MKQIFKFNLVVVVIALVFVGCKSKEKKEEPATTNTDTTAKTTPMTDNKQNMDAVTVAPNLYKVVADTLGIRMVEVNYKPGDSSAMHWHPDYAVYAIEGGTATFYAKDGSKMDNTMKAGMVMVKPGEWHSVKNNGKTNIHVILVEVNRTGAITPPDPKMDATKVAKGLYKSVADTLGIRVLEINYKPGQQSAMHTHSDAAFYAIDDGTAEFTGSDGKKQVMQLKKGMAMITPAVTHSVKNVGKTTMKGILVEVNRAMK